MNREEKREIMKEKIDSLSENAKVLAVYAKDGKDSGISLKGDLVDILIGLHEIIERMCEGKDITPAKVIKALEVGLRESGHNIPVLPKCNMGASCYISNGDAKVELEGEYEEIITVLGIIIHSVTVSSGKEIGEVCDDIYIASNMICDTNEEGNLC